MASGRRTIRQQRGKGGPKRPASRRPQIPYPAVKLQVVQPNGDLGFTFKVVARKSGVEVNGDPIGPPEQGWASAAEHFGRRLAKLCEADRKRRARQAEA